MSMKNLYENTEIFPYISLDKAASTYYEKS